MAVSTSFAPMAARNHIANYDEATARAAAKAGMTVGAWIAHTDRLEAADNHRREVEQTMRQVPRYRGEDAA